ncbi:hypothetical protein HWV62_45015 [Athelia sp. TMB]|nr:hypothetical protein HWV62_45015 [Athelia sp. TMB]
MTTVGPGINANEDTEFNDALRKHGILPQLEPTPPSPSPPPSPTLDDLLDDFTPKELQEISEDAQDDDAERVIAEYRRQRLAEMQLDQKRARFGRVYPIGREDYTREVTESSMLNESDDRKETGTGVVCFLYKDGIAHSDLTFEHIRTLATRHPRTKFVSIVGDKCIPNLPDTRIPMIIIYRKGNIHHQVMAWGADRPRRIEELEALLMVSGAVDLPERRQPGEAQHDDEGSDDEDDHDPSSRMRSAATSTNARAPKNVRGPPKKGDDSDSDFEFDM